MRNSMTAEPPNVVADDPILQADFGVEIIRQMRAIDPYGSYDNLSPAQIIEPFILSKEKKRELPVIGDPDEVVIARIKVFYNAISVLIEKECGLMAVQLVNLTHEGFGRALITVGKLVVMDRTLRDVHRFSFPTTGKMKDEADKILSVALALVGTHSDVAGL
ncbi:MAG: NifX-associated nitrogen fixation protein [Thiohalocapsa sp.]